MALVIGWGHIEAGVVVVRHRWWAHAGPTHGGWATTHRWLIMVGRWRHIVITSRVVVVVVVPLGVLLWMIHLYTLME